MQKREKSLLARRTQQENSFILCSMFLRWFLP